MYTAGEYKLAQAGEIDWQYLVKFNVYTSCESEVSLLGQMNGYADNHVQNVNIMD